MSTTPSQTALKKLPLFTALLPVALLSAAANANHLAEGFYIAPSLSYNTFGRDLQDKDFRLNNDFGFGLGIGYHFAEPWAVELAFHSTSTETRRAPHADTDSDYLHLDGFYHFADSNDNHWAPYVVAGIGNRTYEVDKRGIDKNDAEFNAGAGIKYIVNPNFYLRTDARLTLGTNDADTGSLWNLGLVYIFGKDSSAATHHADDKVAEKVEQVVSKPAAPVAVATPLVTTPVETMPADGDQDGVADNSDKCPDTQAGAKVDSEGCNVVLTKTVEFTLDVKFQTGSSELDQTSTASINELAAFLKQYPDAAVVIEGHSDSVGAAEFNKTLSQKRADSVKNYLVQTNGIAAGRVSAVGYGEEQPIADNATAPGRKANRRVIAKVAAQKKL